MNDNYIKKLNGYKLKDADARSQITELQGTVSTNTSNISNLASYSTNETNTGMKWIDNKPIYRKVLTIPTLELATGGTDPVSGDKYILPSVTHVNSGITDMDFLINMYGSIYDYNQATPAMFPLQHGYIQEVWKKTINITELSVPDIIPYYTWWAVYSKENARVDIRSLNDIASHDFRGYVVLEYTKSTD